MQVEEQAQSNEETQVSNEPVVQTEVLQENQTADNENDSQEVKGHVNPETDDPALVQARINTLYREGKMSKEQLREMREIAAQQSQIIEDLQNGLYGVANHLQQEKFADTESQLMLQYRNAIEIGDIDAQIKLNRELIKLEAQKITAPKVQPKQQQNVQQKTQQANSATELASELDPQEQAITAAWQNEKNDSGQPLRPWAVNSTGDLNDPDPDYVKAITIAHQVFSKDNFAHLTYQQKLQEIDKRMGVNKTAPQQNVMTAHLTGQRKNSKVTMTAKQSEIAVRTKFGGPKAKSDAEHIEAYRKQIESVKSKGAR